MKKDFFVMLNLPNGDYTPMTEGDYDEIAKFRSYEEAMSGARNSSLGDAFGFEVFHRGYGVEGDD